MSYSAEQSPSTNLDPPPPQGSKRKNNPSDDDSSESGADEGQLGSRVRLDALLNSIWGEDPLGLILARANVHPADEAKRATGNQDAESGDEASLVDTKPTGATGAKRRKMDKKKAKKEEQRRLQAEVVESADFRLFRNEAIRQILLIPTALEYLSPNNPRHTLLEKDSLRQDQIRSIAIEGSTIVNAAAENGRNLKLGRRWERRVSVMSIPGTDRPASPLDTLAILSTTRPPFKSMPATLLPPADRPVAQRTIISKAAATAKPLTRAEKREVETWRKARDIRMGVPTRSISDNRTLERTDTLQLVQTGLVPTIEVEVPGAIVKKRGKRREARYWAPPIGIGGKARGYGWGYIGSREGTREAVTA